jgi:hypothetical protein
MGKRTKSYTGKKNAQKVTITIRIVRELCGHGQGY